MLTYNWASDLLALYLGSNQKTPKINTPKPVLHWQPPPKDFFLINTDASLVVGQPGYSLSVVIRYSEGSLAVAEVEFTPGCISVLLAEAAAILLGLQLALRWSIFKAKVGSDSHTIIQAFPQNANNHKDWGQLVQKAIHMRDSFQCLDFLFVARNCNNVANSLAK
ncbi:hypothetical protein F8388_015274 [Cannabis sativa]|uniref:RNase H type-1 domain-containing protein n=1 Tax=Cannabis sativa TaxID=3483 RepID=A0A7J6F1K6_CANSA|nr:hypothetical protein F8388_015274 [Cannabis sativa]